MRIDHIIIVADDADRVLRELRDLGLGAHDQGQFNGVLSWVVPMASGQYLEVVSVDDANPDGAEAVWLRERTLPGCRFAAWAVEVPSLDVVAARLGRTVETGPSFDDKGPSWHYIDSPPHQALLPFFITYRWTGASGQTAEARAWRERWLAEAEHAVTPLEIAGIDLVGDGDELGRWLDADLPVSVQPGQPARLEAVKVLTTDGEIVFR